MMNNNDSVMLYSSMDYFNGFKLIGTDFIVKKIQARKHKKKRINKKWLKKYGYKDIPDYEQIIVVDGCIFAQPRTIEKLIRVIKS